MVQVSFEPSLRPFATKSIDHIQLEDGILTTRLPELFQLSHNYPNPFNTETNIPFSIRQENEIRLEIFDLFGHKVRSMIDKKLPQGEYRIVWDGRDRDGDPLPSGVYFLQMSNQYKTTVRKMVLIK